MPSKQELKRAKQAVERRSLRLTAEAAQLERRRLALERERTATLVALRLLAERLGGDSRWPDELPLDEALESFITEPLGEYLTRVQRRLSRLQAAVEQQPAQPARSVPATLVGREVTREPAREPEPVHRTMTVRSQERDGHQGYRATCVCGWRSWLHATEPEADESGLLHVERLSRVTDMTARRDRAQGG